MAVSDWLNQLSPSSMKDEYSKVGKQIASGVQKGLGYISTLDGLLPSYDPKTGGTQEGFGRYLGNGDNSSASSSSSNTPAAGYDPKQKISDFLNLYNHNGATVDGIYNFLNQNPNSLKSGNIEKALGEVASGSQWQPNLGGGGGTNPSSPNMEGAAGTLDPLAVQMFFQNSIAPYLQQITANTPQGQVMPNLPANYQATAQQGVANQNRDAAMLNQATQAAALQQPRIDQIISMLGASQKASMQNYYKTLATGAASSPNPSNLEQQIMAF